MQLNNDLLEISKWAYQWKMSYHPDVSKQAQEVGLDDSAHSIKSEHTISHST